MLRFIFQHICRYGEFEARVVHDHNYHCQGHDDNNAENTAHFDAAVLFIFPDRV